MRALIIAGMVAFVTACVAPLQPEEIRALEDRSVAFIVPGKTTREDVLTHFGAPTKAFEGERIFTYRMTLSETVGLTTSPGYQYPNGTTTRRVHGYHLVVIFDRDGKVARYRLLKPGTFRNPVEAIKTETTPDTLPDTSPDKGAR